MTNKTSVILREGEYGEGSYEVAIRDGEGKETVIYENKLKEIRGSSRDPDQYREMKRNATRLEDGSYKDDIKEKDFEFGFSSPNVHEGSRGSYKLASFIAHRVKRQLSPKLEVLVKEPFEV